MKAPKSKELTGAAFMITICAYLAAILLGGLLLNALFGWWWADPVAALVMVPIIAMKASRHYAGKHAAMREHST